MGSKINKKLVENCSIRELEKALREKKRQPLQEPHVDASASRALCVQKSQQHMTDDVTMQQDNNEEEGMGKCSCQGAISADKPRAISTTHEVYTTPIFTTLRVKGSSGPYPTKQDIKTNGTRLTLQGQGNCRPWQVGLLNLRTVTVRCNHT